MKTDIDTGFLEQLFLSDEADASEEDIHWECLHCKKIICGAEDNGNVAPDWVEANCEVCVDMDDVSQWRPVFCKTCGVDINA